MRSLAQLSMKFQMLFHRIRAGRELDDELQFHLDREIDENIAAGMSPEAARYAALRSFGNPALLRDQTHSTWSWNWLESLVQDFRSTLRSIRRRPAFALAVIGTMALGIAASAAMFTVVDRVLLRPVPYRDARSLVTLKETDGSPGAWKTPWRDIEQWQAQARSFSALAFSAQMNGRNYLEGRDAAQEVDAQRVSANLFQVLGVQPAFGHSFIPGAPGFAADANAGSANAGSIVLSDAAWREVFAADRNVLGRTVKINNQTFTVAGVMPAAFRYPAGIENVPQVWVPVELSDDDKDRAFKAMQYTTLARLRPGVSIARAGAEMALVQKRVAADYTDAILREDHSMVRVERYSDTLVSTDVRKGLLALLAAASVLWLIACLNGMSLMMARNMAQQREVATRVALGAGRLRITRQMLIEGFVLNGIAALLGAALAIASVRVLAHELGQSLPLPVSAVPDLRIMVALLALTLLSAIVSTTWPALMAVRAPIEPALRQGGMRAGISKRQHRTRAVLVAGEIALSLALLVTCGLLLRTIYTLRQVPLGYRTDHIVVAHLSIPAFRFEHKDLTHALYLPLLDRAQRIHGVESAGLISSVPLGNTFLIHFELKLNDRKILAFLKAVTPGMQRVLGFRMAAGRFFNAEDTATSQPVIVVNQAFARQWAPDKHDPRSILGQKLLSRSENAPMIIVGVLDDERQSTIADSAQPEIEISIPQFGPDAGYYNVLEGIAMDLTLRTDKPVSQVIPELRAVLKQSSPELETATITSMDQIVEDSYGSQRLAAHLLEFFGASALLLSVAGLYGLLAYLVAQRRHEIGVRIALGATRAHLLWMVLRQAGVMLLGGAAAGTALALASGKLVGRFLYGVSAHDLPTIAGAAILLVLCGLLAAALPARRAASVDPIEALKAE